MTLIHDLKEFVYRLHRHVHEMEKHGTADDQTRAEVLWRTITDCEDIIKELEHAAH